MERSGSRHGRVDTSRDPSALPCVPVELDDLGVLRVHGTDAERFLQGQLSNDVTRLAREGALLAGFHNPQGRAIALLRLVQAGEHGILALLPRELIGAVAERLNRFILRAKVRIADESASWRVRGFVQPEPPGAIALGMPGAPARWIGIERNSAATAAAAASVSAPIASADRTAWRLLDIAAGLPQVYARTSELFVAQMLNLDAVDAVSFSKGCYTGQEVIARAHYRGHVKRRMQRWLTTAPAVLAPGDTVRLADGRTLRVVEAAQLGDGRCDFLAVAPIAAGADGEPGSAASQTLAAADSPSATGPRDSTSPTVLEAEPLPLPYGLPA